MAIRFVYFDLGNVLVDFSHEKARQQIAALAGISADQVNQAVFESGLNGRYEQGQIDCPTFHGEFSQATGTDTSFELFAHAWSDIFTLHDRTVPIAANLKACGYRIGILSNTCASHWLFLLKRFRLISQLFDPLVTSFDAQSMKPDPQIYQYATEAAGVSPDEIFFTDDRPENVVGAKNFGWHAEQFTTSLQLAEQLRAAGLNFNS